MGEGDPLYRTAHLGLEHWNNIPDSSRIHKETGTAMNNVLLCEYIVL